MIVASLYHGKQEIMQFRLDTPEAAREFLATNNAKLSSEWRWGLSPTNFMLEDGSYMDDEQANAIRRACGVSEY